MWQCEQIAPYEMRHWLRLRPVKAGRASARVLTYNILADGSRLALSPKHDYCPIELRKWRGGPDVGGGRCARLGAELAAYEADVLCLQAR